MPLACRCPQYTEMSQSLAMNLSSASQMGTSSGRVVVQLLVPLLHHAAADGRLLHGENFVANALADVALAAATDRGHRQTHDVAHGRVVLVWRRVAWCT